MKLKSYQEFIIESILLTSDYLLDLIKSIDDPIAQKFSQLINQDIKTKYNIIDLTDTHDKLSFIPDSQTTTKLKSGLNPIDLFGEKSNQTTIGRIVRSILTDNQIEYTDREIEKFVNKFKSAYDANKIKTSKVEPIRVVKGEDIRFWYLQDNYCQETLAGKGSLGKSCMRYGKCQKFLDIYVNNPEECSLVIYVGDDNKLRGRALLWKTDSGLHLDRVYYTADSDTNLIEKWVSDNFELSKSWGGKKVKLTGKSNADGSYDYYPYMDSFMYYDMSDKTLSTDDYGTDRKTTLELQDTNGEGHSMDTVYCEFEDENYPSDQVVWSDYLSSYIHRDNAVHSNYHDSYIWSDNAVHSIKHDDYFMEDDVVRVYLDENSKNWDYFLTDDSDEFFRDPLSKEYYLIDLSEKDDYGNMSLKKNIWVVYQVEPESIEKYKQVYNILNDKDEYFAVEVDQELFDIKLNKSNSKRIACTEFIKKYYDYLIYTKIEKMIEEKDYDIRSIKDDQLTITDEFLGRRGNLFYNRNQFYRLGLNKFISLWSEEFTEKFDDSYNTAFNEFSRYSSSRSRIFKMIESVNPDFQSSLRSLTQELLENPIEWHLGFWQDRGEIDKSVKNKIEDDITKSFKSDGSIEQSLINGSILDFVKFVFDMIKHECRWNSYEGIRWIEVFDSFLINQKRFRDLVKQ